MMSSIIFLHLIVFALLLLCSESFSLLDPPSTKQLDRREALKAAIGFATVLLPPLSSNAISSDEQQGIGVVTDSSIGKAFRRSIVRGAQVADKLDEKWERLSDSMRDKSKCDTNTGRRLYDNGVRKDGTPIGNPGLGALCQPVELLPLDDAIAKKILDTAIKSTLLVANIKEDYLLNAIQDTKDLVRPSFDRSMTGSEEEKKKKTFNFEFYSTLRSITKILEERKVDVRSFQLAWGRELVSNFAPSATRKDFISPFPEKADEFEDYDYDKKKLLDALGALSVALNNFKSGGLLSYVELSIPYDDYGSVVTIACDDYVPISAEILLSEQKLGQGPIQALVVYLFDKATITFNVDTFYIDPSTTRQTDYNPSQLLLNLNSLSKK
jgi:hypothetical protein